MRELDKGPICGTISSSALTKTGTWNAREILGLAWPSVKVLIGDSVWKFTADDWMQYLCHVEAGQDPVVQQFARRVVSIDLGPEGKPPSSETATKILNLISDTQKAVLLHQGVTIISGGMFK